MSYNQQRRQQQSRDEETMQAIIEHVSTPNWEKLLVDGGLVDRYTSDHQVRNGLKATQMRKFFDQVKKISARAEQGQDWEDDTWSLIPAIKYAKGRGLCPASFSSFITGAVSQIHKATTPQLRMQRLDNFSRIFEAIVACHKFHGGK